MPKRQDIKKLMIIGSGPIIIGQAAEFDFSGSQASRSLREEGYKTVVVNSNPATIQTDPQIADTVYIEPLNVETLAKIIEMERPEGLLPGFGGQTGLNLSFCLAREGILDRFGVELLGSDRETIEAAENRDHFRALMARLEEPIPKSVACHSIEEIRQAMLAMSYPVLVRPAYTLGGTGSGVAYDWYELQETASAGIRLSQIGQVLIEESVLGWKEFEYEVMRDGSDNCITICSMENLNPMGVHTGESIVFAPVQTLTDRENQILRSVSLKIIRALGICGGCNIQFAVDPKRWAYRIIEVNPRVSRSSALASKATGYPIARVSAKIAVGMNLDEIPNTVTKRTTAAFEPALDYVVAKIPRWPFDKFPTVDRRITTQMKSTGEAMAIGSTIEESMLKAIRSLEINQYGFEPETLKEHELIKQLEEPTDRLLFCVAEALRRGYSVKKISQLSSIDPFFIIKIANITAIEKRLQKETLNSDLLYEAKRLGFADEEIGRLARRPGEEIRALRESFDILPHFNMVDTCAGEFEAATPYYYSTYMAQTCVEHRAKSKKRILIIGSGPIRIGQGIEFDYCCVHAALALKDAGYEAIMMNNNPETVSTDFDVSSRLYFEPLVLEDVLNVIERENPGGIVLQFGGQTSINLAMPLTELIDQGKLDIEILGTQPADIHRAEDRQRFSALLGSMNIRQPPFGTGHTFNDVKAVAAQIGYPVIVRPSYVLGGRAMEIVYEERGLEQYMDAAVRVSKKHPVLVDKYIANATEVDVDAMCDGEEVFIGGVMEHIEQAGVHSGDSYCVIPPRTLREDTVRNIEAITKKIALSLRTIGLINIQFAVQNGETYVLEANPRASRTIPYVSKTIGIPLAKLATLLLIGNSINDLRKSRHLPNLTKRRFVSVKGPVFPFQKLIGVDPILGPEMKSTGEVMAIDRTFGAAYFKAIMSDERFSRKGTVYITVRDDDKPKVLDLVKSLIDLGFKIVATRGTADFLRREGIVVDTVYRISEHKTPNALDLMRQRRIDLVINTPSMTHSAKRDGYMMRRLAVEMGIPFITALTSAEAEVEAIKFAQRHSLVTRPLHEYHIRPS
jgi:carbamoyl-phosphate synthase large subunit